MKLLFLDVDGVLNNFEVVNNIIRKAAPLGETQLLLLKKLVTETNCQIVLSSSWRLQKEYQVFLRAAFEEHGIPVWIGITPHLKTGRRADDILNWIQSNVTVPAVVVALDDSEDIDIGDNHGLPVKFKPVLTNFDTGLTVEVVQDIVNWFTVNASYIVPYAKQEDTNMEKAIGIGQRFGVERRNSSCDYSYLFRVKQALEENSGELHDLAYVQNLIDGLEAA